MIRRKLSLILLFILLSPITELRSQQGAQRDQPPKPDPDHENVRYGPHERNVLDLWLARSTQPAPLVLYIHGGGFRGGDKRSLRADRLKAYLDAGFSVAAINYRLTDTAPAPAAYLDNARALQFLRAGAKKWNLNPRLVASTGGSAGAGTSMWLAFHDDLADPQSEDPIARESTRLTCIAVDNGQSSYDPRFAEKIGIPRPNFERHVFFFPFYGITAEEIDTPKAYQRYEEAAPITYLSKDDPPALLNYTYRNEEVTEKTPLGLIVHHPKFGLALKEQMDQLGIECIVQYAGQPEAKRVEPVDFIRKHFERARAQESIDPEKVREIRQKQRQGSVLSADERAYLERAEEFRRHQREAFRKAHPPRESTGLRPLTDLGENTYKGHEGGLYPEGRNQPPQSHLKAGSEMARQVIPRDGEGKPSPQGKIVLLSIGMSNTTQEFQVFQELAAGETGLNPRLVIVDGAQGGQAAQITADPDARFWEVVDERLRNAGVTRGQVQVAWIKQATPGPRQPFPAEVTELQQYLAATVHNLQNRFPNLKIAYLSSRIYAGYAETPLNPEPHAYESAFAVKWLIADQIAGKKELNYDASRGPVKAPWLAWGPYLWADGTAGRSDGLIYERQDLAADGTHPSPRGRRKVARQLRTFFKTEPTARPWFFGGESGTVARPGIESEEADHQLKTRASRICPCSCKRSLSFSTVTAYRGVSSSRLRAAARPLAWPSFMYTGSMRMVE